MLQKLKEKNKQTKLQSLSLLNTSTPSILYSFLDAYTEENKRFRLFKSSLMAARKPRKGKYTSNGTLFFQVAHA